MLESNFPNTKFNYEISQNCKCAYGKIKKFKDKSSTPFITILDLSLPEYNDKNINSGYDLGLLIKEYLPKTKLIIVTAYTEIATIKLILDKIKPNAIICKSDIDYNTIDKIFKTLQKNKIYISETINESLSNSLVEELNLDNYDFEIINCLENGILTKDIPKYVNLSLSTIEKRKAFMKFHLVGTKTSDKQLLEKIKMLNFIKS